MELVRTIPCAEGEIPLVITEPDFGSVTLCVIGVHGFCGHKNSLVLRSVSEEMGMFGAATVCFDLPCHGDNPMTEKDLTLENCELALLETARWAKLRYPDVPVCLFATGFGAFVTVRCLSTLREELGDVRLVMQSPDFRMGRSLLAIKHLTEDEFRQQGRVMVGRVDDRKIDVSFHFYEELNQAATYMDFDMPMLLIHGERDEVIPLEDVTRFRMLNEKACLVIIPEADHQFRGSGQWDMVVDLTRDWFEFQQVTLCDYE